MIVNYYTILGVPQNATEREIKMAFKQLALRYHPDRNPGNLAMEEQFKTVNEAYQVLSDPHKRELHNLRLQYAQEHERIRQQQRQEHDRYRQTREPASVRERHYRPIPKQRHFSRRDYLIVAGIFAFIICFSLSVSFVMNHVSARSRYNSALPLIEQGNWSSAHSMLSDAIHFKEEYAEAYTRRAFIEMNIYQNYAAAVLDFESAMKYSETVTPQIHYHKGKCHFQLEEYGQAAAELTLAVEGDPTLTFALFERGEIRLFFLNQYELAVQDFSAFLATGPDGKMRHDALMNRGYGNYQLNRYRTALDDYEEAGQEEVADNGKRHYWLGKAELALGNRRQACLAFVTAYNKGYRQAEQDLLRHCVGK